MSFYVNEDRPTNQATVHRALCIMARVRTKDPRDGQWHGPFKTTDEALDAAEGRGLVFTRICRICNPRSDLSIRFPSEEE